MRPKNVLVSGGASLMLLGMACGGEIVLGDAPHPDGGTAQPDATTSDDSPQSTDAGSLSNDPPNDVVPTGGTTLTPGTLAVDTDTPTAIAVDATHVYWTTQGSGSGADGTVRRVAKAGGESTVLVSGQTRPLAIARSGDFIYWSGVEEVNAPIYRRAVSGGSTEGVDFTGGFLMFQDDANLFWAYKSIRQMSKATEEVVSVYSTSGPQLGAATVGGGRVFFVDIGQVDILSVPIGGGSVRTEVTRNGAPNPKIAADASHVYWSNPGEASIYSAPIGGGQAVKVVNTAGPPDRIAVYDGALYWTILPASDYQDCAGRSDGWPSLQTSATTGGVVRTIADGYPTIGGMAFDQTSVYWITSYGGCTAGARNKVISAAR